MKVKSTLLGMCVLGLHALPAFTLVLAGCSRPSGPELPVEVVSADMGPTAIDEYSRLLSVTVRLASHAKYSSNDFSLVYLLEKPNPEWKGGRETTTWPLHIIVEGKMIELGIGLDRPEYLVETHNKSLKVQFVFIVPTGIRQVTLLYKNQSAGKPLTIGD